MPLYMDVPNLGSTVSIDDVAKAHTADLQTQTPHDVQYLRYWVDESAGKIFCLVDAPSAEAAKHRAPRGARTRRRRDPPCQGRHVTRGVLHAAAGIAAVRAATTQYEDAAAAQAAEYDLLVDAAGIACIDNPAGGMGIHYVNVDLVLDPTLEPTRPEVLVYEPDKHGNLRLVAVEYVVFETDWPAEDAPPLFGEHLHRMPGAGESEPQNRYGLPAFYELHLWLWKHNPSGMFEDWNGKVSC